MQQLWICNNEITKIKNLPENLFELHIHGNPIKTLIEEFCECNVQQLKDTITLANRLGKIYLYNYYKPGGKHWQKGIELYCV